MLENSKAFYVVTLVHCQKVRERGWWRHLPLVWGKVSSSNSWHLITVIFCQGNQRTHKPFKYGQKWGVVAGSPSPLLTSLLKVKGPDWCQGLKKPCHLVVKGLSKQDEMGNDHSSWGLVAWPSVGGVGGQRSAGVGEYLGNFSVGSPCHFCPPKSWVTWGWAPSWSQQHPDVVGSVVRSYRHFCYLVQGQFSFNLWTIKHGLR